MGSFLLLNPWPTVSIAPFLTLGAVDADGSTVGTGALASSPLLLLAVYCGLIAVSSLCGGMVPLLIRMTHTRMQILVSAVGGFMLGVGIFHQLPHAVSAISSEDGHDSFALDWCMGWLMFGLLLTFFMLRMFHFHSHGPVEEDSPHDHDHDHDCGHDHHHAHSHAHDHSHGHSHEHSHGAGEPATLKGASWIGILLGLSLHTLLDGVALAANVKADALHFQGSTTFVLLGLGTFLGVALHKPLDSMSITSLMAAGGWSRRAMQMVNLVYALMCPLGAFLFYFGIQAYSGVQENVVAAALAMSAGVFICISLSDLLPEVQFHSHDRLKLSAWLLLGVATAWGIGFLEPPHSHGHQPHTHGHQQAPHQGQDDHDHSHGPSGHRH
ncbi:ZIP family metal transporter [Schlesneria sp. T3-172]|uniref:ZIP family metal transporter n=1 Tax=Schlesneria sphaerica TaxID=3373610 RepID=UPI0037CA085D